MNTIQAKQEISINSYLQSLGYQSTKIRKDNYWYLSPFRKEKTASFVVNTTKNTFIDWGTGQRGTIIDLVMMLNNTDISESLKILSKYTASPEYFPSFSFKKQENQIPEKTFSGTIEKIIHPKAISYLEKRGIKREIWENCGQLFQYKYPNPTESKKWFPFFYNVAWKNDNDGYELRNEKFKSCLLKKDITTIPGEADEINLFEGFFDYLSALVYYKANKLRGMTIVLNTVMILERALPALRGGKKINVFFDNDQTGEIAFSVIQRNFKKVVNQSKIIYPDYKDFNEFLVQTIRRF